MRTHSKKTLQMRKTLMNSNKKRQLLGPREHPRGQKFNTKAMRGLQCGKPDFFILQWYVLLILCMCSHENTFCTKLSCIYFAMFSNKKKELRNMQERRVQIFKTSYLRKEKKKIMKRHFLSLLGVNRIKVPNLEIKVSKVFSYRNSNRKVTYFDGKQ